MSIHRQLLFLPYLYVCVLNSLVGVFSMHATEKDLFQERALYAADELCNIVTTLHDLTLTLENNTLRSPEHGQIIMRDALKNIQNKVRDITKKFRNGGGYHGTNILSLVLIITAMLTSYCESFATSFEQTSLYDTFQSSINEVVGARTNAALDWSSKLDSITSDLDTISFIVTSRMGA